MGFFSQNKRYLGVDIGSFSTKLVELIPKNGGMELSAYAFSENKNIFKDPNQSKDQEYITRVIRKIYEESGASSKAAVSTIPSFSVFSSVINLHNVETKDMREAVEWEAKKLIPLPLEEMALDWKIIGSSKNGDKRVFLTGSPKKLTKKYVDIFRQTDLNLVSLETESFSLIRSLMGDDKSTVMLVQMGASNTDIFIVQKGIPILNRSIDSGGTAITKAVAGNLNIGLSRAEQFKMDMGMNTEGAAGGVIPKTIASSLNPVVNEIKYLLNLYKNSNSSKDREAENVEKIILSGGASLLPGLSKHLSDNLDMNVIIGDPWSRISYPQELKPVLSGIGPIMSIAAGSAIKEIE